MDKKVLVTDKVHPLLIDGMRAKGLTVDDHPKMSYEDVRVAVAEYQGLIINSKVVCDKRFLDEAVHLDFIGRLGSGLDIIDLPYAEQINVAIISSPEGNANAVAEHALGMLLSLTNSVSRAHHDVLQFKWNREPNRGTEITGKTIGLIGFGHTGSAFANKLSGMNVKILVYDKYRKNIAQEFTKVKEVTLDDLIKQSDVISIHLPLTLETRYMVDKNFLSKMKENAILINTSRGKIVVTEELNKSLKAGRLSGACLDVLENEKPETWTESEQVMYTELFNNRKALITPHIAGWTHQSLESIASILLKKICNFYQL